MSPQWGYAVTALAGVLVGLGLARAFLHGPFYRTPTVADTAPPTVAEVRSSLTSSWPSPDCRQGKHAACTGVGFDDALDDIVDCPCACHHPEETP